MALRSQKIQMGQNKITGLADATDALDAVNLSQIQSGDVFAEPVATFVQATSVAQAQDAIDVVPGTDVEYLGKAAGINTQTGTSYTLALSDKGKVVEMNNASANTLTIPPNSSVAFDVGTYINLAQIGAGQTTVQGGSGVTIRQRQSKLKFAGQYATATLYKRGTDEWLLSGDLTT